MANLEGDTHNKQTISMKCHKNFDEFPAQHSRKTE